mgnify:CR=1 FL=1
MATFGLIGKTLSHSFSKPYFEKKFQNSNLEHTYSNFELNTVEELIELVKTDSTLAGLNVTIPFKEDVIPLLDSVSNNAKKIGAVNCILIQRSNEVKLIGHNTDWIGFKNSLEPLLKPNLEFKALVLGTGGASKAICYALMQLNIPHKLVSRERGDITYEELTEQEIKNHKLIINTTPIGMSPNGNEFPFIPYLGITNQHIAYDLIYNPEKTQFLRKFELASATIKNGLEMLSIQAEKGWEIWQKEST